ncbi:hypothetical protein GCM10011504_01290 [Siccirubricoccus deserti]|uniref:Uncharacterized protein n=1 Tax=Siccirubricoccus deserti TaxID=2013562 RepID=A0A9X0UC76_9PROT|nr:hypothetical protein [Siccirubricoccus deserti]MBC4014141.1 hypothetical protein [Siccirubricoccus deserti]GGC26793.1 hypothetical protein GCM10011504_01290 [Siccirubricoccus deserti]
MDIAALGAKPYDRRFLDAANPAAGGRYRLEHHRLRDELADGARGLDGTPDLTKRRRAAK